MFGMGKKKEEAKAAPAKPVAPGVASAVPASIPRGIMPGQMQDWKLTVNKVIEHAHLNHGSREIVTRSVEGPIVRSTYSDLYFRARKCSNALLADGVQKGDRIATLAWNTARHIEVWYGTMCIGAVLHTLNPRLFPEQIAWIINHAQDRVVMTDLTFVPVLEQIAGSLPSVERYVVLTDRANMPQTTLKRYFALLETTFLVQTIPAWGSNRGVRLTKAPKVMLTDTGLACHLLGVNEERLKVDGNARGALVENL